MCNCAVNWCDKTMFFCIYCIIYAVSQKGTSCFVSLFRFNDLITYTSQSCVTMTMLWTVTLSQGLASLAVHGLYRVASPLPSSSTEYGPTTSTADAKMPGGCSDLVRLVRLNLIRFLSINNTSILTQRVCFLSNDLCTQIEKTKCTVWVKKISRAVFWHFFPNGLGF